MPPSLVLEASVLLHFWLCLAAWQRDPKTPGRRSFMLLTLLGMCWGVGELATVCDWLDEPTADRIKYVARAALPPLWFGLAYRSARTDSARGFPWLPVALGVPALAGYGLAYSGEWLGRALETLAVGADIRGYLWAAFVAYGCALTLWGSALLVAAAFRRPRPGDWKRLLAMGGSGLVPLASIGAHLAWKSHWPYDPTPAFLAIGLLGLRSGLFSGGLFQALSVSQHELIHQLPHGIVVTNTAGMVIEMNPAGERILGLPVAMAVGRSLDALLYFAEADLEVQIIPVDPAGEEGGNLVMLERAAKKRPGLNS